MEGVEAVEETMAKEANLEEFEAIFAKLGTFQNKVHKLVDLEKDNKKGYLC